MKFICSTIVALGLLSATGHAAESPKAVLELFTSQGCSSCPPADKLAEELAKDQKLIVISYAVDYWDYLGWKDTLARHEFTERQRAYGARRGDNQVYTPQVVVNGGSHAVGSERGTVEAMITKKALTVTLEIVNGHKVKIPASSGSSGELVLVPVVRSKTVAIGKGENQGRSVTYTNIALKIMKLADWQGQETTIDLPIVSGADDYIVLLQAGTVSQPNKVLGAVQTPALK